MDHIVVQGVPISEYYAEVAKAEYSKPELIELIISFAARQDIVRRKELRKINGEDRSYDITLTNEVCVCLKNIVMNTVLGVQAECGFMQGCPDASYRRLFTACFISKNSSECVQLNLNERFCLVSKDGYGVRKGFARRLFVLLNVFREYVTSAVISNTPPPWYRSVSLISDDEDTE